MPVFDLGEVNSLADAGGYPGLCLFSQRSSVIILSAIPLLLDMTLWQGASDFELTAAEEDEIDDYVSSISSELLTNMIGTIIPYATTDPPPGMLACDGTQYLREDYPELYNVLAVAFIDDADNFTVPDLQDQFPQGEGTNSIGDTGGNSSINLSSGDLPSHSHTYNQHTLTPIAVGPGVPIIAYTPPNIPSLTGSVGSGDNIDITPSYLCLGYGIVTGRP